MKLEEKVGELLKAKKNVIRHVTGEFQRVYKAKEIVPFHRRKLYGWRDCRSDYFRSRQFGIL